MLVTAVVSVAMLIVVSGLFLYQAHAESVPNPAEKISAGVFSLGFSSKGYLSDNVFFSARASKTAPVAVPETQKVPAVSEIHIAQSGLVLLRGARVVSVSGSTIGVGVTLGSSHFAWTVETSTYTKFLTPKGEKLVLEDVVVGDVITVTGKLNRGASEPTIDADFVREL